jgi:ATP-dependent DNA helicase RecG
MQLGWFGNFVVTLKNNFTIRMHENQNETGNNDLVDFCKTPRTRNEIAVFLGKTTYYAMRSFVDPLIEEGKLKMTVPDKPRSRNQRYYSE